MQLSLPFRAQERVLLFLSVALSLSIASAICSSKRYGFTENQCSRGWFEVPTQKAHVTCAAGEFINQVLFVTGPYRVREDITAIVGYLQATLRCSDGTIYGPYPSTASSTGKVSTLILESQTGFVSVEGFIGCMTDWLNFTTLVTSTSSSLMSCESPGTMRISSVTITYSETVNGWQFCCSARKKPPPPPYIPASPPPPARPPPPEPLVAAPARSAAPLPAIIAGVTVGLVVIASAVAGFLWHMRRRRAASQQSTIMVPPRKWLAPGAAAVDGMLHDVASASAVAASGMQPSHRMVEARSAPIHVHGYEQHSSFPTRI